MSTDSPFKVKCKNKFQTQVWIVSIGDEEPITIEQISEKIEYLRSIKQLTFTVTLTHRTTATSTKISKHRAFFDAFLPVSSYKNFPIKPIDHWRVKITPIAAYLVQLPTKPKVLKSWGEIKHDPNKNY